MSRYFPHSAYAEDQPLATTILTSHVLVRAVTTGAVLSVPIFGASHLLRRYRASRASPAPTLPSTKPASPSPQPAGRSASLTTTFLRASGRTTAITVGVVGAMLVARMWGRERIEWQDRSWRLLESKSQMETDGWTLAGSAAGLAFAGARAATTTGAASLGALGVLGSAGMGSALGVAGYMVWRYGVNKGRFD